jgi:chromosome partitioning protein
MNIVVTNLKGGVGKTTTAVYLSAVAVDRGYDPVLLIDADRQASSAEWLEERPIEGVTMLEAPSERTLTRAMGRHEGMGIVDTPPGDERLVQSAINSADAVLIPTRAGGVEYARVAVTLGMIPKATPRGVLIAAARLGTNDLEEAIAWWNAQSVPIWGRNPRTRRHRGRARGAPLPGRPPGI